MSKEGAPISSQEARRARNIAHNVLTPFVLAAGLLTPVNTKADSLHVTNSTESAIGNAAAPYTNFPLTVMLTESLAPDGTVSTIFGLTPKPDNKGSILSKSSINPINRVREQFKPTDTNIPYFIIQGIAATTDNNVVINGYKEVQQKANEVKIMPQLLASSDGGNHFQNITLPDTASFVSTYEVPHQSNILLNVTRSNGGQSFGVINEKNIVTISPSEYITTDPVAVGNGTEKGTITAFARTTGNNPNQLIEITLNAQTLQIVGEKILTDDFQLENTSAIIDKETGEVTNIIGTTANENGIIFYNNFNVKTGKNMSVSLESIKKIGDVDSLTQDSDTIFISGSTKDTQHNPFMARAQLKEENNHLVLVNLQVVQDKPINRGTISALTMVRMGQMKAVQGIETTGVILAPLDNKNRFLISTLDQALRPDKGLPLPEFPALG